jgi:hypothetical protein
LNSLQSVQGKGGMILKRADAARHVRLPAHDANRVIDAL